MKKYLVIILLLAFATTVSEARPKLRFNCGYTYDFGDVKQKDSPLKADITLFNQGKDTLIIKRVKPMCGCTTAPLSKREIAPGDSAILKVTLNVEHYEGEISKRIGFSTNYRTEQVFLSLKANVYKPISLFPGKYFNFTQMYLGEETNSKIVLNNLSGRDINVIDVIMEPADITLNLEAGDIIPKDTDYVLEAVVNPTTLGPFTARIDILIDDPDQPSIRLSGFGKVDPADSKVVKSSTPALKLSEPDDKTKLVNPTQGQQKAIVVPDNAVQPIENNPNFVVPNNRRPKEFNKGKVPPALTPSKSFELRKEEKPPENEVKEEEVKK